MLTSCLLAGTAPGDALAAMLAAATANLLSDGAGQFDPADYARMLAKAVVREVGPGPGTSAKRQRTA